MLYTFELSGEKTIRSFGTNQIGPYPHWHEHCELMIVEKGNLMCYIENEVNPIFLEPGAILFLKGNVLHTPSAVGNSAYRIHIISFHEYGMLDLIDNMDYLHGGAPGCKGVIPEKLRANICQMLDFLHELTLHEKPADVVLLKQYTAFLLGLIGKYRVNIPESRDIKQIGEQYLKIRSACKYIEDHPEENPNPADLAKISNYSLSHFYRLFSDVVGCSVHEYMIRVKIREAQKLLRSGMGNVTEVSYRLGFSHPNNFSRTYRRLIGINPSEDIRKREE